ncbi:ERF family protein [Micromonospora arborensis]|uniref:ERF family protein n=1 Tax=Micromonospora arborensis TaxID=2116518 RepID=UPI0033C01384
MAANISEVLLDLQADPPVLVKDKKGQVGNQKTKYADLVQVNEVVLSRLNKLGVIYSCTPTLDDEGKFVLAYELEHVESKTSKTGRYPLKLADNPMQMGSAITYARRYVLLAITGIAAEDEDDDGHGAAGHRTAQRQQRQQPAQNGQATAQRAQRPTAQPPLPGENPNGITPPQQGLLHKLLNDVGKGDRDAGLSYISGVLGRPITTTKDLTKADAKQVIDRLQDDLKKQEQPA